MPQMVLACSQTTYCCASWVGGGDGSNLSNYTCCNSTAVFDAGPADYLAFEMDFVTTTFSATTTFA